MVVGSKSCVVMAILQEHDTLALHTVQKNDIANNLYRGFPYAGQQKQVDDYAKEYQDCIHRERRPCLRYNCHGLTFASRRTAINDSGQVQRILQEDGYIQIQTQDVKPGDIVIYRKDGFNGGEIEHSGIVVGIDRAGLIAVPVILSKWGICQEVIHPANRGPYTSRQEYYRLMP